MSPSAQTLPRRALSIVAYPAVIGGAMAAGALAVGRGTPRFEVLASIVPVAVVVLVVLERVHPFRREWNRNHDDLLTDVIHTVMTSVLLPRVYWPLFALALAPLSEDLGATLWPAHWPLAIQVVLALLITEFVWYWLHRLCHEWPVLWRWHAVHHSSERQYWLNGSRDHPVAVLLFALTVAPLVALGCSEQTLILYLIFNGVHGAFQHANVNVRLGPLNWLVSMSELHRWHHSTAVVEANHNYGHNLIVWDVIFGSRFLPERPAPATLGISDMPDFPKDYWGQLLAPFRWRFLERSVREPANKSVA